MDTYAAPDAPASPVDAPAAPPSETGPEMPSGDPVPVDGPPAEPAAATASPSTLRRRRLARRALAGLVGVALLAGVFTAGVGLDRSGLLGGPAADGATSDPADFALIGEAWDLLHEKYVGASGLDGRAMAYAAIEGLTGAVDDPGHTSFLTPEDLERSRQALSGSFVGVGIQVDEQDGVATVVGVLRGSPAEAAGVHQGDRIVAVDGTPVIGVGLDKVVSLVRGTEGTSVTLSLQRAGTADPIEVSIVRATITTPAVSWAYVPGSSIVMLRIEQFSTGSADEFKAALADVLATKPSGIVLDLRGNPGGYVNEAISVASQFLTTGDVHLSRDAKGTVTPTAVFPGGLAPDIPLVVLVDHGSASSAEIVAGALQDPGRAELVGQRTYGTGTVLSEVPLRDGSALRIGVIEWLTPRGRSIWREGLTPDDQVAMPSGVSPVAPDELVGLNMASLRTGDLQLAKALDILQAKIEAAPAG